MTSASEDRWRDLRPDPENDTPLYLQLARKLGAAIHENRWNAGEALPSERVLSEALGVSRITSRKAIALLVEQGLIRRTQGAGSFITPRYEDPLSRLSSFSEMLRRRGFTPSSKWLSREILPANRDEVIQLGLSPAAAVTRLRRLRMADGIVMAVENSTFPAAVIPDPQGDRRFAVHVSGESWTDDCPRVAAFPRGERERGNRAADEHRAERGAAV